MARSPYRELPPRASGERQTRGKLRRSRRSRAVVVFATRAIYVAGLGFALFAAVQLGWLWFIVAFLVTLVLRFVLRRSYGRGPSFGAEGQYSSGERTVH